MVAGSKQGQTQKLVDRRMMQALALDDVGAAGHAPVVEQLLPVEGPRQRRKPPANYIYRGPGGIEMIAPR